MFAILHALGMFVAGLLKSRSRDEWWGLRFNSPNDVVVKSASWSRAPIAMLYGQKSG